MIVNKDVKEVVPKDAGELPEFLKRAEPERKEPEVTEPVIL